MASVDFSKAFDLVWHSAPFYKLLLLKLPPRFVLWVRSFLSKQRAKVQIGGSRSLSFRIRRGVPQGSVLGPGLFILFVDHITNDLPRGAHASQYADDLAIWSSSPGPLKAFSVVQSSLNVLETWSNLWRLPLNPKKCESSFFFTDPHQTTFQPLLNLLGIPLLFNPTPKILVVTFDRTLSFGAHVQSLFSKFYSRHKALRSIATASWGPTKESLSLLYKVFVRPVLTYTSPGWFPYLCNNATNHLEVLERAACRVITGCLSSTPSSLLLLEAQLPPLKLTLEHQALSFFESALRLPPDFSNLNALATRNVSCGLKKKPSWRLFYSSATQSLPSPRETLIMCPPFPPWTTTHFTVSSFISDLTGNSTAQLQSASNRLSSLHPFDIQVWTDGSAPSLFVPGSAGVHVTCSKCYTSNSLSFSSGGIASSFTAETFALKQGLEWCTNHLLTCKFQSVIFLTDSQSALSIFSSAPFYFLPESLWNVWSLASSLSNNITLNFQWVPGHAGLPGNENAYLLAKAGASCPLTRSHALSPQSLPKSVISSTTIEDVTSPTPILTTKAPKSLRRNCSFLALFAVSFPVFAAMVTVFFYLHIFTGSVGRRILLVVPVDTLYRTSIISSSTVLPLSLFINLSLAPLSQFLTYGPDLGVWPDWVSVEFLRATIHRKSSGSTTNTYHHADVECLFMHSFTVFALERSFAWIKRYFDHFQVLRTRLELLRSLKIF